jgi:hypothetical protein
MSFQDCEMPKAEKPTDILRFYFDMPSGHTTYFEITRAQLSEADARGEMKSFLEACVAEFLKSMKHHFN